MIHWNIDKFTPIVGKREGDQNSGEIIQSTCQIITLALSFPNIFLWPWSNLTLTYYQRTTIKNKNSKEGVGGTLYLSSLYNTEQLYLKFKIVQLSQSFFFFFFFWQQGVLVCGPGMLYPKPGYHNFKRSTVEQVCEAVQIGISGPANLERQFSCTCICVYKLFGKWSNPFHGSNLPRALWYILWYVVTTEIMIFYWTSIKYQLSLNLNFLLNEVGLIQPVALTQVWPSESPKKTFSKRTLPNVHCLPST
jgi:hypothetical protein